MPFPAAHFGAVKRRRWYKVRWNDEANPGLVGKTDLLPEDVYEKQKLCVQVLDIIPTDTCTGGAPLRFGAWSESQIDSWIKKNRV